MFEYWATNSLIWPKMDEESNSGGCYELGMRLGCEWSDSMHKFSRENFGECLPARPRGRRKTFMKMDLEEISGKKWKWMELAEDLIV